MARSVEKKKKRKRKKKRKEKKQIINCRSAIFTSGRQSKSDGDGGRGGGWEWGVIGSKKESPTPFMSSLLGA